MTSLAFLGGIAVLFALVLTWEGGPNNKALSFRPAGIITWLISGNWPAKVGAALVVIGTGALLRYMMMNIELPANVKLLSGVIVATVLGAAAGGLKGNRARRAIHLALAGAALGVAYLTAYSAYGFFGYVNSLQALGALFIVACVATVFAISERAISIALLAMVGAFLAPAFALQDPDPSSVFGYYLVASLLVLVMVFLRGWRPLIHLSFLFTLAGGLFFGWTQEFYTPTYYSQMQPMLLLLVGVHLAMPFVEAADSREKAREGSWLRRFDLWYFLLLPLAAMALTLAIAPNARDDGALGLLAMSVLWVLAAGVQHWRFHQGAARYGGIALLFVLVASLLWLDNIPYFLIGAVVACALLALGPSLGVPEHLDSMLVSVALACTAGYLLQALFESPATTPFANTSFMRNAVLALMLGAAGHRMRLRGSSMSGVFLTLAATWFFVACAREFIRLKLDFLPQLLHLTLLAAAVGYAVLLRTRAPRSTAIYLLIAGLFFSGLISAKGFDVWALLPLMIGGQIVVGVLAEMAGRHDANGEQIGSMVRSLLPLLALPWAIVFSDTLQEPHAQVVMTLLVCSALAASLQAQLLGPRERLWPNALSPLGFVLFGFWLFYLTLFHIERDSWAIAYELVALVYLLQTLRFMPISNEENTQLFKLTGAMAIVCVLLATLLRLIGPPGILTILDLNNVLLPAALSLCLAGIGGAIAWWSARIQSRRLWGVGTLVLAASAGKLVFFDFGSLGQLGNIFAMLGAGGVFLLVAWLVPIPPKAEQSPPKDSSPSVPIERGPSAEPQASLVSKVAASPTPHSEEKVRRHDPPPAMPAQVGAPAVIGSNALQASRNPKPVTAQSTEQPGQNAWLWIVGGFIVIALFHHHNQGRKHLAMQEVATTTQAPTIMASGSQEHLTAGPVKLAAPIQTMDQSVPQMPAKVVDICSQFVERMPANFAVYASGAYSGRPLGYSVKPSNHEMQAIDVYVDEPGREVVLALGAYEPTIWDIRLTRSTRIAGVIVSGYHQGAVNGLGPNVPILKAAYDDRALCGHFYIDAQRPQAADRMVQALLKRPVDTVYVPNNGRVSIGRSSSPDTEFFAPNPQSLERLRPPNAQLYGAAGLDVLVQEGKLRLATAAELEAWANRYRASHGSVPSRLTSRLRHMGRLKVYIMLQWMEVPKQLTGMNVFIVPSGVAVPLADINITILSNDPPKCTGMLCGID